MPTTPRPQSSYFPPAGSPQPGAKRPVRQLGHTAAPFQPFRAQAALPVRQLRQAATADTLHARAMNRTPEPAYIARHYLQPPWQAPGATPAAAQQAEAKPETT